MKMQDLGSFVKKQKPGETDIRRRGKKTKETSTWLSGGKAS